MVAQADLILTLLTTVRSSSCSLRLFSLTNITQVSMKATISVPFPHLREDTDPSPQFPVVFGRMARQFYPALVLLLPSWRQ